MQSCYTHASPDLAAQIHQRHHVRKADADGDDLLGDAYEYLMRHVATESGKRRGQF
ncbi:hypothetical protein CA85_40860 [Allorhodopirellula solitaria]|uniref:DNA methylase adenine-specific domain-containing protein n=1 Tax=Allorhodopirellula solitaria TaxID=2527987 RepID=A0A5C5X2Z7_9BACT|nr:hypothetical protein CA85_40860 [Allorhodopirellula solitaria]